MIKKWDEIGKKLDKFYKLSGLQKDVLPSSMLQGALATIEKKDLDWMAQAAHSLREIFYKRNSGMRTLLTEYGSIYDQDKDKGESNIEKYYGFFSEIAHHNSEKAGENSVVEGSKIKPVKITPDIFEGVVDKFGDVVLSALKRQLDAHDEIDKILQGKPDNINRIKELINLNLDTRDYFFYKADKRWLDWLWKEGFLDILKGKTDKRDENLYPPEVAYLVRMAEKTPARIAKIISQVKVSS